MGIVCNNQSSLAMPGVQLVAHNGPKSSTFLLSAIVYLYLSFYLYMCVYVSLVTPVAEEGRYAALNGPKSSSPIGLLRQKSSKYAGLTKLF